MWQKKIIIIATPHTTKYIERSSKYGVCHKNTHFNNTQEEERRKTQQLKLNNNSTSHNNSK